MTHAGDIRSNSGADGCRWGCCVVGLQDISLVGLSAVVSADPVFVDLLGSVSRTFYVEKGAEARKCRNADG